MTDREMFKIWAPQDTKWTDWVRPVPFIGLDENKDFAVAQPSIPQIFYKDKLDKNTVVVLDLPDYHSIEEGLALAAIGYRPIPLFNGCDAQKGVDALVDNRDIKAALIFGAKELAKLSIPMDAPPVFLLDKERLNRHKISISVFDNSWDIYTQDMPSSAYLVKNGINKIIVRSDKISKDLKLILYKYQKSGIKLFLSDGFKTAEVSIKKPLRS